MALNQALNYPVGGRLDAAFDVCQLRIVKDAGHSLYHPGVMGQKPTSALNTACRGTNLSLRAQ